MNIKDLLPAHLRANPVWVDMADAFQTVIVDPMLTDLLTYQNLRDPITTESAFLSRFQRMLGLFIDTGFMPEDELRRLIDTVPRFLEKSGTDFYIQFLEYFRNMELIIRELYTTQRIISKLLDQGDGIQTSWSAVELDTPNSLIVNTVTISDGVEIFTDDGLGVLTGDQGGSGTVNYLTGDVTLIFNTAPTNGANINLQGAITNDYQTFVVEESIGGPLTIDGGDWYLTNHVNITYDISKYPQGASQISKSFYQIAPLVLVINEIVAEFTARIVTAAVVMAGVSENGVSGTLTKTI